MAVGRGLAAGLLALFGLPLVQALRASAEDPVRCAILALAAIVGIAVNLATIAGNSLGMTVRLRWLASGLAVLIASAAVGLALRIERGVLAELPVGAGVLRGHWELVRVNLFWLAAVVVGLAASVWLLPRPERSGPVRGTAPPTGSNAGTLR